MHARPARRELTITMAVTIIASCATPTRRLPLRAVEDPIVLPKHLAGAWVRGEISRYEPSLGTRSNLNLGWALGLTDRLEWNTFSLVYAILDDAPGSPLPHARISLSVQAGVSGFGFSSIEGWIALPVLEVKVLKHVADRWALSTFAGWYAGLVENPPQNAPEYTDLLFPGGRRWSEVRLGASALRQLTEHIAVGATITAGQLVACANPFCEWSAREGTASLRLLTRPAHWLTLIFSPSLGGRYRPAVLAVPLAPTGPASVPPTSVAWFGLAGTVAFFW
jgi:hypothetical protein